VTTKLSAALPDDDMDLNGLTAIRNALLADPRTCHYVVAIVDCSKITKEIRVDGVAEVPTARLIQIEPVEGRDADLARALLDRAHRIRTGRDPLPLDFGAELRRLEDGER
jgi:hypothetical protein